jgi:hypothetical protein
MGTEFIMDGTKILSVPIGNQNYGDSPNCFLMIIKFINISFDHSCEERHYTHSFNTARNLNNEGPYLAPKYFGAEYLSGDKKTQIQSC